MKLRKVFAAVIVLVLVVCGAAGAWAYHQLSAPRTHAHSEDYVEIPKGSSPNEVLGRLARLGIIGPETPTRLYVRLSGRGPRFKAGQYRFPSPITPMEVLDKLEEGEQRLNRLVIVEGWTRWDVADLLARIPELRLESSEQALTLLNDPSLIRDLDPAARDLEGYLFPDTYSFPPETDAATVVKNSVQRFREVWVELNRGEAAATGRTMREIVTVASLIETEAKLPEERPLVASVIYNRLRLGMALGIDSTVIYASKLAGKWRGDGKVYLSDLQRESPYNTRKVSGLPPGPIASPGRSSLEAALRPARTDYLYYVREPSRNDGAHNFYSSESEFQRGVQSLREWERARNANETVAAPR
jgi:UPF0755 protein